jgi:hypothetical protein
MIYLKVYTDISRGVQTCGVNVGTCAQCAASCLESLFYVYNINVDSNMKDKHIDTCMYM